MPTNHTVVAAATVASVVAAAQLAGFARKHYNELVERREAEQTANEEIECARKLSAWREAREAEEEARAAHAKPGERDESRQGRLSRAMDLYQLQVAHALDDLTLRLRALQGLSPLAGLALAGNPGNPEQLAAYAGLLFPSAYDVLGRERITALTTFGGTLATFTPATARVVDQWVAELEAAGPAVLRSGPGPSWEAVNRVVNVLSFAEELAEEDSKGVSAWACVIHCRPCDMDDLSVLLKPHVPSVRLHRYLTTSLDKYGKNITLRARSAKPYTTYCGLINCPPGEAYALLTCCMPPEVEVVVKGGALRTNMPWSCNVSYSSGAQIAARAQVAQGATRLLASVFMQRAAHEVLLRLRSLQPLGAPLGSGCLAGCGWEHCAALMGSVAVVESVMEFHDSWWQVAETLQSAELKKRVAHPMRERLLREVPPPPADSGGSGGGSAALLRREVDAFVDALLPLTLARYMGVRRSGGVISSGVVRALAGGGRPAADVVPATSLDARMLAGFAEVMPAAARVRVALRTAQRRREERMAAATRAPEWLPFMLVAAASVLLTVVMLALQAIVVHSLHLAVPWAASGVSNAVEAVAALAGWLLAAVRMGWLASLAGTVWRLGLLTLATAAFSIMKALAVVPELGKGAVEWTQSTLNLGCFLGRYNLATMQLLVERQLSEWAVRIAEGRMREAVGRGCIGYDEVLCIMDVLQAAAAGGTASDGAAGGTASDEVEVELPGSEEEVAAFLKLPVTPRPPQAQAGKGARKGPSSREATGSEMGLAQLLRSLATPVPLEQPLLPELPAGDTGDGGGSGSGGGGGADDVAEGTARGATDRRLINKRAAKRAKEGAGTPGSTTAEATATEAVGEAEAASGPTGSSAGTARREGGAGGRGAKAVSTMLAEQGWVMIRRRKHIIYRRQLPSGGTQTFGRSCTPSDFRTAANQLAALRRLNFAAELDMRVMAQLGAPMLASSVAMTSEADPGGPGGFPPMLVGLGGEGAGVSFGFGEEGGPGWGGAGALALGTGP